MPVTVNEMDTQVEVETRGAEGGGAASAKQTPAPEAQRQWQQIARRFIELEKRTAAWGFDD